MNNDLISRSALKKKIEEVQYTQEFCIEHQIDYSVSMQMLGMVIDNAPTVEPTDIKPVRDIHDRLICPCCGSRLIDKENGYADRL